MAKILTLRDMYFSSPLCLVDKFVPKGSVLELIDCGHSNTRMSGAWSVTRWSITISTERGEFSSVRYVEHKNDTPIEKLRPFIYLEN